MGTVSPENKYSSLAHRLINFLVDNGFSRNELLECVSENDILTLGNLAGYLEGDDKVAIAKSWPDGTRKILCSLLFEITIALSQHVVDRLKPSLTELEVKPQIH